MSLPCQDIRVPDKLVVCIPVSKLVGNDVGMDMIGCKKCQGKQEYWEWYVNASLRVLLVNHMYKENLPKFARTIVERMGKDELKSLLLKAARNQQDSATLLAIAQEHNL